MEPEHEDFENTQSIIHIAKKESCSGETPQGVPGQPFAKEIMGV